MRILLDVAGDKQVERELLRIGGRAVDAAPAFRGIADYLMSETRQQFESEGAHASGGWTPLKPATLARKRAAGLDLRILHATGALERSLTEEGDPKQILEVHPQELVFGSRLVYGAAHQNPRPASRLPRRRPIELTEVARKHVVKVLQRYLMTGEVAA